VTQVAGHVPSKHEASVKPRVQTPATPKQQQKTQNSYLKKSPEAEGFTSEFSQTFK
jgi:hypothetical protein